MFRQAAASVTAKDDLVNQQIRRIPKLLEQAIWYVSFFYKNRPDFDEHLHKTCVIYGRMYVSILAILTEIVEWFAKRGVQKCVEGILKGSSLATPLEDLMEELSYEERKLQIEKDRAQLTAAVSNIARRNEINQESKLKGLTSSIALLTRQIALKRTIDIYQQDAYRGQLRFPEDIEPFLCANGGILKDRAKARHFPAAAGIVFFISSSWLFGMLVK